MHVHGTVSVYVQSLKAEHVFNAGWLDLGSSNPAVLIAVLWAAGQCPVPAALDTQCLCMDTYSYRVGYPDPNIFWYLTGLHIGLGLRRPGVSPLHTALLESSRAGPSQQLAASPR